MLPELATALQPTGIEKQHNMQQGDAYVAASVAANPSGFRQNFPNLPACATPHFPNYTGKR
jgi:hypothetical protein